MIVGHVESACPTCGMAYRALRTGLTFASVRQMMHVATDDTSEWRRKRRGSVLGYWRELKVAAWRYHLDECAASRAVPSEESLESCPF